MSNRPKKRLWLVLVFGPTTPSPTDAVWVRARTAAKAGKRGRAVLMAEHQDGDADYADTVVVVRAKRRVWFDVVPRLVPASLQCCGGLGNWGKERHVAGCSKSTREEQGIA